MPLIMFIVFCLVGGAIGGGIGAMLGAIIWILGSIFVFVGLNATRR